MRRTRWTGVALILGSLTGGAATAGLLDSPPPALDGGATGRVVYRMGPVHYQQGSVNTEIACTNLRDVPTPIAVEIFDENDHRIGGVTPSVLPPNGSRSIVTSVTDDLPGGVAIAGLPAVEHGKARVTAASSRLTCTAQHRIRAADGSVKQLPVELVKKVDFGD